MDRIAMPQAIPPSAVPQGGGETRDTDTKATSATSKQAILVALAAGLGYGFDSYAVNIFGMLSPLIRQDLGISVAAIGTIGSIFLAGYTLGTFVFGVLADRLGRRAALRLSILLYGASTVLGGMVNGVAAMAVLRFATGLGGAGELAVGAPYAAEVWPKQHRAVGTGGIMFALYAAGFILAAGVALLLVPRFGWRSAFLFAAIPATALFWFRSRIAESPRFRESRAAAVTEDVPDERSGLFRAPAARRRLFAGFLLYVANTCGYWGITFFLTTFMIDKFHLTPQRAIFWAMIFYVGQLVLSLVGTALSDRYGRRPAGIAGALLMIGCIAAATTAATFATFAVFGVLMIGMLGWLWGIGDTYLSEFFRTAHRGTAFGIMVGAGRAVSIAAPSLVGWGLARYGPTPPFLATAGLWLLTIIGYWIGPETARKELEDVQL